MQYMFAFYLLGFLLPFFLSLTVESVFLKNVFYLMCFFTQIFFISFEIIQVMEQKAEYFLDLHNWNDFLHFFFFVVLYISKVASQFQSNTMMDITIQAIIILQAFNKTFYYIRIYDRFMFLITISYNIFVDLIPFITMVCIALLGFTKISQVVQTGVNDPAGELKEYNGRGVKMLFQTYKQAVGQKIIPDVDEAYSNQGDTQSFSEEFMLMLITIAWLAQNSFFAYFGVIFLAQVFQAYEKHYPRVEVLSYRAKARFNEENFQILDLFVKQREFKVINFQIAKSLRNEGNMEYEGVIRTTQKHMRKHWINTVNTRRDEISRHQKCINEADKCLGSQRKNFQHNESIKRKLIELAGQISNTERRCCCEIEGRVHRN